MFLSQTLVITRLIEYLGRFSHFASGMYLYTSRTDRTNADTPTSLSPHEMTLSCLLCRVTMVALGNRVKDTIVYRGMNVLGVKQCSVQISSSHTHVDELLLGCLV